MRLRTKLCPSSDRETECKHKTLSSFACVLLCVTDVARKSTKNVIIQARGNLFSTGV